jgi:hypothetical protein
MSKKRPPPAAPPPGPTDDELARAGRDGPATVEDLIERLKVFARLAPGARVVQSKDGEGNEFSPLLRVGLGVYEPRDEFTGDLRDAGEAGGAPAVVLWPVS